MAVNVGAETWVDVGAGVTVADGVALGLMVTCRVDVGAVVDRGVVVGAGRRQAVSSAITITMALKQQIRRFILLLASGRVASLLMACY